MLRRTSSTVAEGVELLTAGESCFYLLTAGSELILFDCGATAHVLALERRLADSGRSLDDLTRLFVTHGHAERISGLPLLRSKCPRLQVHAAAALQAQLRTAAFQQSLYSADRELSSRIGEESAAGPDFTEYQRRLEVDHVLPESETFEYSDGLSVHCLRLEGHAPESSAYLLLPAQILIVDETAGYFRGRELAAPGADNSLTANAAALARLHNFELAGLALPFAGLLTGALIKRHLAAVSQNLQDLQSECTQALQTGTALSVVQQSIHTAFYQTNGGDQALRLALNRSSAALCRQLTGSGPAGD